MSIDFTEIFCYVDDSFQELDKQTNSITQNNNKSGPKSRLNRSEIITTIIVYLQQSYDCFKHYHLKQIWIHHQRDFHLVSDSQFIKIIGSHLTLLVLIFKFILDQCDGISFVDSSSIEVCKKYRISMHKVFSGIEQHVAKQ